MGFKLSKFFSKKKKEQTLSQSVLGIDIGASSIKVVEIEDTDKALTLKTYGELQLGPYVQKDLGMEVEASLSQLTEALVDIIRESNVKATSGILAMPLSSSFVTVVPIIAKNQDELASRINVEARKYIPIPFTDVALDWAEIKAEKRDNEDSILYEVLLAAVQKDAFAEYRKLLSSVNMESQTPEIEIFSTLRGVAHPPNERVVVIDLGASVNKLYISINNTLERIHRVPEGGARCTSKIAQLLNVPFEEAENLKRAYKEKYTADIHKAFIATSERSIQEFKRVIDQYETRLGTKIEHVVLTGGGATYKNAVAVVREILVRDVSLAMPFAKVAYPAFMEDTLKEIGPTFTTSLGAALRFFE